MDASCASVSVPPQKHRVTVDGAERELGCEPGQDVLNAAIKAGVSWLPVGCRGGGCGVCRVAVRSGSYEAGKMSKRLIASDDPAVVLALACKLYPRSDLELERAPIHRSPAYAVLSGDSHVDR
jgi:ferredoxin